MMSNKPENPGKGTPAPVVQTPPLAASPTPEQSEIAKLTEALAASLNRPVEVKKTARPAIVQKRGKIVTNSRGIKERTDELENGKTITTFLFADASDEKKDK